MLPGEGNPTLRWGLTGAIGLTVIGVLFRGPILLTGSDLLGGAPDQTHIDAAIFYFAIGCLSLIAYPAILFTCGIFAARDTGKQRSGATTGATAMVISDLIITLAGLFTPAREAQTADLSNAAVAVAFLTSYTFCGLPIRLGILAAFGATVGALGGRIGRRFYRDPLEDVQMPMSVAEAQYLGILPIPDVPPMPGMPGAPYPGAPFAPPPPPGYPPYPTHPPYPPGYQRGTGAPAYPYPPAQFAPPPPGVYPQPPQYPPQQPPQ